MKCGKVYLVGAGPGDPGLITLKALRCLERADVVIYDRLLDERLLETAPPQAERIYVGKASSRHTLSQSEINDLLLQKAMAGKTVVRLKGGDPFVFGRGAEEAAVLAENQVAFEVVPGVTSAVAVPAYAGIPVTDRRLASSFAVITGHEEPSKPDSRIQWARLATGVDTLVFVMGTENLPEIVARLIENGRPADTPVAVIAEGTRPHQKTVTGQLENIVSRVQESRLAPPAIIVVGEVVNLRQQINWFDNRPLFGKRVLVTRARPQASQMSQLLTERGAICVELPAISIQPIGHNKELEGVIGNLGAYQWAVFTSVNGVTAFFDALRSSGRDSRALGGMKVAAIGPATAAELEKQGISTDFMPADFSTEGIIAGLCQMAVAGQRFLLPRADIADRGLAESLEQMGATVQEIDVYRTSADTASLTRAVQMVKDSKFDVLTFTSSSTATNLLSALGHGRLPAAVKTACIGAKTAEALLKAGVRPDIVASEHTIPGLVDAIEKYFAEAG